jgi:hypothetical protein
MEQWLATRCTLAGLPGRKVLIVGVGGGCDIISAYAVSRLLPEALAWVAAYGNTKKRQDNAIEPISAHVFRLTDAVTPITAGRRTHGTVTIDCSVPRGPGGCPFIFLLPQHVDEAAVADEVVALGFDVILGVDTGGDSIVGDPDRGASRDKRMLRVLRRTGLPLFHAVLAPGSDGESSFEDLQGAIRARVEQGSYAGCFALEPVLAELRKLSESLSSQRTPRIILAAAEGRLECDARGRCVVPRGIQPAVPREWLTHGFVFRLT